MTMLIRPGAALMAAVLFLSGCSSIAERGEAAAAVATRLLGAVQSRQGAAACALLAPQTALTVAESAGSPCAEAILDEELPEPGTVTGAQVYGQWAQVRLTGDTVFLGVFADGWRVVAAGCTSRGERPYDCVLQGS